MRGRQRRENFQGNNMAAARREDERSKRGARKLANTNREKEGR